MEDFEVKVLNKRFRFESSTKEDGERIPVLNEEVKVCLQKYYEFEPKRDYHETDVWNHFVFGRWFRPDDVYCEGYAHLVEDSGVNPSEELTNDPSVFLTRLKEVVESRESDTGEFIIPFHPKKVRGEEHVVGGPMLEGKLLESDGRLYQIQLRQTSEDNILEYVEGYKKDMSETIKRVYRNREEAVKNRLQQEINNLKQDVTLAEDRGLQAGLTILNGAGNWEMRDNPRPGREGRVLLYDKYIEPTHVKLEGVVYELKYANEFWIDGFYIELRNKPRWAKVYKESKHVNVDGPHADADLCMGDLQGKSLHRVIEELPQIAKVMNLDSPYHVHSAEKIEDNTQRYLKDSERGEVVWM